MATKQLKKKSGLSPVLKKAIGDRNVVDLAKKAGVTRFRLYNILGGQTKGIQRDLALRLSRLCQVSPKVFEPFLSDRVPHGARKRKVERQEKRAEGIFKVTCPCCEGDGTISVRKV